MEPDSGDSRGEGASRALARELLDSSESEAERDLQEQDADNSKETGANSQSQNVESETKDESASSSSSSKGQEIRATEQKVLGSSDLEMEVEMKAGDKGDLQKMHDSPFPGSRLMIREMVLENFKSYAGVKKIGPFHKCFSSVVGPNGSGKSNVIDALLFVFGKRAKKLRLSKVSELIHNSTEFPNCEYAKVSVYFQNIIDRPFKDEDDDEGFEVVPDSQLEVARFADKNNKSDYFVDGKKKSFAEVAALLEKRGIDLHNNRFLILQGEVEQISLMKPKAQTSHEDGLLEYLEDIIGSNKYVEAIEEASKKVEELTQARTEKLNRVKVVEKEKESLEDAKNEAEEFLSKDAQLLEKRGALIQLRMREKKREVLEIESKREKLAASLAEEEGAASESQARRTALQEKVSAVQKEHEKLAMSVKDTKKQFAAFERKDVKHREDHKYAKSQVKEFESAAQKYEEAKEKHQQTAESIANEVIPALEEEIESLKAEKVAAEEKLEGIYQSLQGETAELRTQLELKQKNLAPLSAEVAEAKSKLDVQQTQIDLIEERTKSSKLQLEQAYERLEEIDSLLASRPTEIQNAKKDLDEACANLQRVTKELEEVTAIETELDSNVKRKRVQTETAKAQLASSSNQSTLLKCLAEGKSDKKSSIYKVGLYGRLGDLGTIPAEYDVAVSTACGSLDFIVTETTKGAEECVEYMRKRQLGRATFAILEKLSHLSDKMNRTMETPENVPRLFDLIDVKDDKFKIAFYFAMRDTLVARDLDQAVRIAYKGKKCVWRVVTMKGEVIDTSGTMSGGGKKLKRGAMKLQTSSSKQAAASMELDEDDEGLGLVTKDSVTEMEVSTSALIEELRQCREKKSQLTKEKARLEKLAQDLSKMLPKLKLEIEELEKQRSQIEMNAKEIEPKCRLSADEKKEIGALRKTCSSLEKAYEAAQSKLVAVEKDTASLHEQIAQVGGERVRKLKRKIDEVEAAIEENRKKINKAHSDVKAATTKAEKSQKALEDTAKEIVATQKHIEDLKTEFEEIENGAAEVLKSMKEVQILEEEKKAELSKASQELQKYKSKSNKVSQLLVEMKNQLAQFDDSDLPKAEKTLEALQTQLDDLEKQYVFLQKERLRFGPQEEEEEKEEENDDEFEGEPEKKKRKHNDVVSSAPTLALLDEQLDDLDEKQLSTEIDILQNAVARLKKVVNMASIKEYRAREVEYTARVEELDAATKERDEAREGCEVLRKKRLTEFMDGFSQITLKLKEMYQMITLGGDAELELVDSCDPFSEGLVLSVRPPKKSWKVTANLSGGEKTLSSLALVFALHHYKPTPLYVMDEIDAALDFKNVSIIGNYIRERTRNAQFIVISLRNNMFELADRLVGIYKTHDVTKSITINPGKIVRAAEMKAKQFQEETEEKDREPLSAVNR